MKERRAGSGCLVAGAALCAVAAAGLAALVVVLAVSHGAAGAGGRAGRWRSKAGERGGVDENPQLSRVWSCGSGDTVVVRIPLQGIITRSADSGLFGGGQDLVGQVLSRIQDATMDEEVMAIILEVDSPGGEVTASDVLHRALIKFKQSRRGRKVVAVFGDVAASGGYYVAVAADHIVAHPTTLTGSIGVLISTLNFKELGDKVGIRDVTVKSGANKDLLNPLKDLDPEQLAIVQEVVDEVYGRFVQLVADGRNLDEAEVRALADGRIMTARQAEAAKLVDQIGYWDDALAKTAELLGEDSVKVFRYEPRSNFLERLLSAQEGGALWRRLMEPQTPRMMYVWSW